MQEGGANENESAAIEEKEAAAVLPPPAAAIAAAPPPPPPAEAPPLPPEAPPLPPEAPPLPVETVEAAPEAAAAAAAAEAPEAETEAAVEAEEDSVTSEESEAATMVKIVGSLTEFQTELSDAGDKLIVVDFSATWCGPCKMIKPFFHSMVEKYPDVIFIEIDVDDAQDVASQCDVKCMPTFQFYKNNEKVHEFSGANKEKLEEAIKKYM